MNLADKLAVDQKITNATPQSQTLREERALVALFIYSNLYLCDIISDHISPTHVTQLFTPRATL